MKFTTKQLTNGNFANFTGKKCIIGTETDSEQAAKENAIILEMNWHHKMVFRKWYDLCEATGAHRHDDQVQLAGEDFERDMASLIR